VDDFEPLGEAGAEALDEIVVELDGNDAAGALQEFLCESAAAGADLDDQRLRGGTCGRGDTFEDGTFNEKMLPEALPHA
jgi:hypothetical protein